MPTSRSLAFLEKFSLYTRRPVIAALQPVSVRSCTGTESGTSSLVSRYYETANGFVPAVSGVWLAGVLICITVCHLFASQVHNIYSAVVCLIIFLYFFIIISFVYLFLVFDTL